MKDELRALKSLAGSFPSFNADATPDNPKDLFSAWLREAIEAGIREPHAMTLSTVDETGSPDARVLILKNLDERGFHFATSNAAPKGQQIAINPYVALTFYWSLLGRQVRIRGVAIETESHERDVDFLARPAGSRAAALLNRQSDVLSSDADLDAGLAEQRLRLADQPDLIAPNWAVFVVMPHEVEFWQGNEEGRHQRLRYRRDRGGWIQERLWP
ncbi:pyridoxal 5'-phosphate synthase [Rhizobium sp. BK376]|uniref:pyridoxine/pyridoxamine 5'-phosphate oxidase n=1 Tax=Rhizobium sp. BK376 TaxID=2512149 RepID=UPI001044A81E|nr:pyridoxal 5'-phosphate synthase [Rhizobium sp. BK376]TCR91951.1 pyridoxamine 5'-phosphate oxidase [Rhizobium sp. BK376]